MPTPVDTLLVDARPVDHPTARQRGIGRYVTGLLSGLHATGAPLIALVSSDIEAEVLDDAIPGLRLERWSPGIVRAHAAPGTWYLATQLMLHPIPLDPIPAAITAARLPVAAVMYDVIPYRFPERYQVDPNARRQAELRKPLANTVDAMLAISRFSADTAVAELGFPAARMRTIGAGIDQIFLDRTTHDLPRADRVLPPDVGRYVVSVTGGDERKNTEGLLRAWALVDPGLRAGLHLVIATAASGEVLRRWRGWADEVGIGDELILTGSVTDDEMVSILHGAELAVMPSTEEGFGLPVVEAAACGCPVICSNVSSLPEVLEEPQAEFDPYHPAAIAAAIERGLTDEAHRQLLQRAGHRAAARWQWPNVADELMSSLASLGPRWPQRIRSPRRRLAVVGPVGGTGSGIGTYDERLLEALARRDATDDDPAIDVFVDTSYSPEPVDMPRRPARALGRYAKPWDYDDLIAVLGSSPHHVATAELAATQRCHVWLHETSLVGVHVGLAHASGSQRWALDHVTSVLERTERSEMLDELAPGEVLHAPRLDALGITMLAEVLDRARTIIVSSDQAAATVRALRPDGAPIVVIPLANPPAGRLVDEPAPGDIVAAGWLAPNKAPELALEAFAALSETATLTFAGPADPATVDTVTALAQQLGLAGRVTITGHLDDDAYRRRLAGARVGLQLRRDGRGEMSAAVSDLLSLGVPVVTTLATAGPPSAGVRIVDASVASIVAALAPLLDDDDAWHEASGDALGRGRAWTFDDVAAAVLDWVRSADGYQAGSVHRRGPTVAGDR